MEKRRQFWRWVIFGGLVAAGITASVLLHFYPPGDEKSFWPRCAFHEATGLLCPGCGSTRALYAYTHGDILRGLQCNLLLPFMIVLLSLAILKANLHFRRSVAIAFFTIIILFTILRNLPFGCCAWLAP